MICLKRNWFPQACSSLMEIQSNHWLQKWDPSMRHIWREIASNLSISVLIYVSKLKKRDTLKKWGKLTSSWSLEHYTLQLFERATLVIVFILKHPGKAQYTEPFFPFPVWVDVYLKYFSLHSAKYCASKNHPLNKDFLMQLMEDGISWLIQ